MRKRQYKWTEYLAEIIHYDNGKSTEFQLFLQEITRKAVQGVQPGPGSGFGGKPNRSRFYRKNGIFLNNPAFYGRNRFRETRKYVNIVLRRERFLPFPDKRGCLKRFRSENEMRGGAAGQAKTMQTIWLAGYRLLLRHQDPSGSGTSRRRPKENNCI